MNTHLATQFDDPPQQQEAALLGMWAFIATEVLFFGVLLAAYIVCRFRFPAAFAAGSRHTDLLLGSIETAVLLLSGCLAALGLRDMQCALRRRAAILTAMTAVLGLVFLVLHGMEYHDEYHEGLIPGIRYTQHGPNAVAMELFFCLYYIITGLHSLHVLIGVVLLSIMAERVRRGAFSPHYYTPLEVVALYWSLVDIVWIFVYPAIYLAGRSA
jgi:cytochrome c oxidase subunit III